MPRQRYIMSDAHLPVRYDRLFFYKPSYRASKSQSELMVISRQHRLAVCLPVCLSDRHTGVLCVKLKKAIKKIQSNFFHCIVIASFTFSCKKNIVTTHKIRTKSPSVHAINTGGI